MDRNNHIEIGTRGGRGVSIGDSAGIPKYVGARAEVIRIPNVGVRIRLTDYKGTTEEVVAEAIESIVTNNNGSLTFTLPDGRTFTTDSLKGDKGDTGDTGLPGNGIDSIEKTGTSGLIDTYTITYDDGDTDTFTVTNGEKGDPGEDGQDGQDGFSPVASVSKSGDTATISITDKNGTTTATVSDGADGQDGSDGADGADGFSPTATVTKSGSTTTISITDKDGTTTEDVYDGVTSYNDLTDKPTIPSKVSDLTNDSGFITTETDPTVPSWAKASTKPAYTAEEVGALPDDTEIPSKTSDLENDSRFIKAVDTASGAIATFKDAFIKKLTADINPIQDLHGYTKPWVGGAGKNLLFTDLATIKSQNTNGSWSGNTYTYQTVTFEVQTDESNNITGIKVNGTATGGSAFLHILTRQSALWTLANGSYVLTGCPSGGSSTTYGITLIKTVGGSGAVIGSDYGGGLSFDISDSPTAIGAQITLQSGQSVNGMFYPMIRKSTDTATFAPYSNICPISGWTECDVSRTNENLCPITPYEYGQYANGVWQENVGRLTTDFIPITPNVDYVAQVDTPEVYDLSFINYNIFDSSKTWLGNAGQAVNGVKKAIINITNADAAYIRLTLKNQSNPSQDLRPRTIADANLWFGIGNTFIIDLDGTRYGGTLDVTSGVMVVTHVGMTFDTADAQGVINNSRYAFKNNAATGVTRESYAKLLCDKYACARSGPERINGTVYAINGQVIFVDDRFTSLANAQSVLASEKPFVVYPLATPITVQLTPTQIEALVGENNVWASTGEVELELVGVPEIADKIPFAPTSDGTYTLKVTITDGEAAYSWVADE